MGDSDNSGAAPSEQGKPRFTPYDDLQAQDTGHGLAPGLNEQTDGRLAHRNLQQQDGRTPARKRSGEQDSITEPVTKRPKLTHADGERTPPPHAPGRDLPADVLPPPGTTATAPIDQQAAVGGPVYRPPTFPEPAPYRLPTPPAVADHLPLPQISDLDLETHLELPRGRLMKASACRGKTRNVTEVTLYSAYCDEPFSVPELTRLELRNMESAAWYVRVDRGAWIQVTAEPTNVRGSKVMTTSLMPGISIKWCETVVGGEAQPDWEDLDQSQCVVQMFCGKQPDFSSNKGRRAANAPYKLFQVVATDASGVEFRSGPLLITEKPVDA